MILASNTSSISITQIASFTHRPELVMGMHFMNPVPLMVLVELIEGLATSKKTSETVRALAQKMGKTKTKKTKTKAETLHFSEIFIQTLGFTLVLLYVDSFLVPLVGNFTTLQCTNAANGNGT